jgi:capsular polysaccharide biosynthesis protein
MTIADVYKALWRHRLLILVLTSLVVALTWFATEQRTEIYKSSVLVRVSQPVNDPNQAFGVLEAGQQLAQIYAKIVETRLLAEDVYAGLNKSVPLSQIEGQIHGSPLQNLELLSVSATNPNPVRAATIANAVPDALRAFVKHSGTLHEQVTVVDTATPPSTPYKPNLKLNLALALLLGLFVNGGIALLYEFLSDRLPDLDELESVTGYPTLGNVPSLRFASKRRPLTAPFGRARRSEQGASSGA